MRSSAIDFIFSPIICVYLILWLLLRLTHCQRFFFTLGSVRYFRLYFLLLSTTIEDLCFVRLMRFAASILSFSPLLARHILDEPMTCWLLTALSYSFFYLDLCCIFAGLWLLLTVYLLIVEDSFICFVLSNASFAVSILFFRQFIEYLVERILLLLYRIVVALFLIDLHCICRSIFIY